MAQCMLLRYVTLLFLLAPIFVLCKHTHHNHKHTHYHSNNHHGNSSIGFEILFETNMEEFEDKEIFFEKPLPKWLKGSLVKNGPARFEFGSRNVSHVFDGYAKLRKISFHPGGKATFSSRFIQSDSYRDSTRIDDVAPYLLFRQPHPEFDFLQKFQTMTRNMDNMNVNVYQFHKGQDHVVIQDIWNLYTMDITNLSTKQQLSPPVPNGGLSTEVVPPMSSSHPQREYGTGNWITFANIMQIEGAKISVMRIKSPEERELIAEIQTDRMHYMHCFGMTRNYMVLMAHPMYFSPFTFIETADTAAAMKWDGSQPMLVYVVHIKTGDVKKLQTSDSRFIQHFINSYEIDANTLVVDFSTFDDASVMLAFDVDFIRDPKRRDGFPQQKAGNRRYVIHLDTGEVLSQEFPHPPGMEFMSKFDLPAINENYMFKPYCLAYGVVIKADGVSVANMKLIKKDLCDSRNDLFWYEPNHYPSEPTFVPKPNSFREEDGLVISLILDGEKRRSYVGIFEPKTMKLINRAYLPTALPFLFHGRFFD